jgi:type II secretory pathway component PulL
MPATVFFDITGNEGSLRVFEDGRLSESTPFELGGDGRFYAGDLPEGVKEAILSLPLSMLDFRVLELPFEEPERIREVLPFELEGIILGGTERVVMDAVVLGKTEEGKTRTLAVYVEKAALERLIAGLSELGADPRVVTSVELARAIHEARTGEDLERLLLASPPAGEDWREEAAEGERSRPTINLRQGELAYTRDAERTRRSLAFAVVGLIALILILAGDVLVRAARIQQEAQAVQKELVTAYAGIFPGEKPEQVAGLSYKLKARMEEMQTKSEDLRGVSPLEFLMNLQAALPGGIVVDVLTLDTGFVIVKGKADTLTQVEEAKSSLDTFLHDVKITDTGQAVGGKTAFTIEAKEASP